MENLYRVKRIEDSCFTVGHVLADCDEKEWFPFMDFEDRSDAEHCAVNLNLVCKLNGLPALTLMERYIAHFTGCRNIGDINEIEETLIFDLNYLPSQLELDHEMERAIDHAYNEWLKK